MNYCYDILINMNEDSVLNFYEWDNFDPIELVKKIPLYRVSSKTLKDFYLYDIKVSNEFLSLLLDKTVLKNNKINKTIKYACLLCDSKNTLIVEFDNNGQVLSRSSLLLDDEANIIEFIYNYNETKLEYQKISLRTFKQTLRQEDLIKKVIIVEIDTLIANNNEAKLKYLFNEWFGYEENNVEKILIKIREELKKEFNSNICKIYEIIKKSYNNV